ncbi:hypothetical protein AX14_000924 [Amanita brunnescens Koide BX004]|nr:hypothetical protein AX14_000924 [Amanita brunnescens Koide BX004]
MCMLIRNHRFIMPATTGTFKSALNAFIGHFYAEGLGLSLIGKFNQLLPSFNIAAATITYKSIEDFNGQYAILPPPPLSFVGPDTVDITLTSLSTGTQLRLKGVPVPPLDKRYIVSGQGLWENH